MMDMKTRSRRSGQAVLEYAIIVSIVAGAFAAMAFYVKRAVQGSLYSMEEAVTGTQTHPPRIIWRPMND